jgi:hypothetical protein
MGLELTMFLTLHFWEHCKIFWFMLHLYIAFLFNYFNNEHTNRKQNMEVSYMKLVAIIIQFNFIWNIISKFPKKRMFMKMKLCVISNS